MERLSDVDEDLIGSTRKMGGRGVVEHHKAGLVTRRFGRLGEDVLFGLGDGFHFCTSSGESSVAAVDLVDVLNMILGIGRVVDGRTSDADQVGVISPDSLGHERVGSLRRM